MTKIATETSNKGEASGGSRLASIFTRFAQKSGLPLDWTDPYTLHTILPEMLRQARERATEAMEREAAEGVQEPRTPLR